MLVGEWEVNYSGAFTRTGACACTSMCVGTVSMEGTKEIP